MNRIVVESAIVVALAIAVRAAWEDPGMRIAMEDRIDLGLARLERGMSLAGETIAAHAESLPKRARIERSAMTDAAINASIRADLLKDPDLSVLKIDVDTRNGAVVLNGLAEDASARERAGRIAGSIKGVREVRNYLVVKRA